MSETNETNETKMIRELTMNSDLVSMVARIWRKYYICGRANPGQLAAICFVLIDAEVRNYVISYW